MEHDGAKAVASSAFAAAVSLTAVEALPSARLEILSSCEFGSVKLLVFGSNA